MSRREDAEYLAPAALTWFVLHTRNGRITGAAFLAGIVVLGLVLGAMHASGPLVVVACALLGASIPLVLFPLAVREQKAREKR